MRRKAKAELGTFSASAIDLFASALGAFIIITVVLFPYFPNLSPDPLKAIIEQLREDKQGLEAQVADLSDQNVALTNQNNSLQGQVTAQAATIQQQQGQITSANAQAAAAQQAASQAQAAVQAAASAAGDKDRQIADLQGQLDGTAFIGIEPEARNFQLVFDMSGSIGPDPNDPITYPGYVRQVTDIADSILSRLGERDSLRVVTYQGQVASPNIGTWPSNGGFVNSVSDPDKSAAQAFVTSALRNTGGFTPTFEALEIALAASKPTTIIIVTDGVPQVLSSDGSSGASRSTIASAVQTATSQNNGRHQINIIAIGDFVDREQASAIVPLATQNGGVLVAMP